MKFIATIYVRKNVLRWSVLCVGWAKQTKEKIPHPTTKTKNKKTLKPTADRESIPTTSDNWTTPKATHVIPPRLIRSLPFGRVPKQMLLYPWNPTALAPSPKILPKYWPVRQLADGFEPAVSVWPARHSQSAPTTRARGMPCCSRSALTVPRLQQPGRLGIRTPQAQQNLAPTRATVSVERRRSPCKQRKLRAEAIATKFTPPQSEHIFPALLGPALSFRCTVCECVRACVCFFLSFE